jgi:O-antigen biosynthesis protein WbqP
MYKHCAKRIIDIVLSTVGIIILIPFWIILAIAIKVDDPGPIFFRQKRIAKDKDGKEQFFQIYKYRSMKMSTPSDVPTHMLKNPEQYITKVGAFLRKTSLDELPQIFNIWKGQMSIIGPRPALWNQDDLYAERAKYGANDVMPGLTGWAQINGRDELEIDVKAKLDGEYVQKMSFMFDCKCFFGTIFSVLRSDGVVEGGTGELNKREK